MTAPGAAGTTPGGAGAGGSSATTDRPCARGHYAWYTRPDNQSRFCRRCNEDNRRARRGSGERLDPTLCQNQIHPRTPGGCPECREAKRIRDNAKDRANRANPRSTYWLWDDHGAEYWFLRKDLGLTPQEIAAKANVRWESFQRTLFRRIGGKREW